MFVCRSSVFRGSLKTIVSNRNAPRHRCWSATVMAHQGPIFQSMERCVLLGVQR